VRWKHDLKNGIAGTILINRSRIYAMNFQESLIGLDIGSGKPISPVAEVSKNGNFLFPSSPAIWTHRIFYATRDGRLRAISAENQTEIWSSQLSERITSDVAANSHFIFVSSEGKKIYQIAQETGKIHRTFSTNAVVRWKFLASDDNLIFLEWDDNNIPTLKSLDVASGKEVWSQPSPGESRWDTFRPLLWKNLVIVGSTGGHVMAFDSSSGDLVWSTQVQGVVRMLGASEHFIYAGCSNGFLYALLP
jgi:outer membrane protein assembly factor BamB